MWTGAPQVRSATRPARRTDSRPTTSTTPAATSDLSRTPVPNAIDGDTSSSTHVVSARSGTSSRTCGTPVRALAAASSRRTSSPTWYGRICASSVPSPRPLARRSPGSSPDARRASSRSSASTSAPRTAPGPCAPAGGASGAPASGARLTPPPPRAAGSPAPTAARIRASTSSAATPSPSASYVSTSRWRSTSRGEVGHVLGDRVRPPAQQRERLRRLDQPDRAARAGAVLDQRRDVVQPVAVGMPRGVGQRDRVADHLAIDEHPLRRRAVLLEVGDREPLAHLRRRADRAADHGGLLPHVRVVDQQLEQEAVDLRLGQRIGPLRLDRVLRGEHEERRRQRMRLAADRHLLLLHHLEQCRLHLRGRAVDLVGEQEVAEHGAELGLEPAAVRPVHARADEVGRHQVGRELHAPEAPAEHGGERLDRQRLGEPGHAFEQHVPAGEQRHEQPLEHRVLADDHPLDLVHGLLEARARVLGGGHLTMVGGHQSSVAPLGVGRAAALRRAAALAAAVLLRAVAGTAWATIRRWPGRPRPG